MQSAPITALALFSPTADAIEAMAQPPGRAAAMAASLRTLADKHRPDARFSADVMRLAYLKLSGSRPGDAPPVAARRATCLEIADAIGWAHILGPRPAPASIDIGALSKVLSWWAATTLLPGDDARSVAIRETASRELAELEDAIRGFSWSRPCGQAGATSTRQADASLSSAPRWTLQGAGHRRPDAAAATAPVCADAFACLASTSTTRNSTASCARVPDACAHRSEMRRDAAALRPLVAVLVQALEALPESAKVSIDVIMNAIELSADEANVVTDVLIAVKPALARACGVTSF
jgi:hypothetical protein